MKLRAVLLASCALAPACSEAPARKSLDVSVETAADPTAPSGTLRGRVEWRG